MRFKRWVELIAGMTPDECREAGTILISMADAGPRDAGRDAVLRDFIDSLPEPLDNGLAALLGEARAAAGRCCNCGRRPATETQKEEQSA